MEYMEFEKAKELADKWNSQLPKRIAKFAEYRVPSHWPPYPNLYVVRLHICLRTYSSWNAYTSYYSVFCREFTNPVGWK